MGGPHVALRSGKSLAGRALRLFAARQLPDPRDLLVHCAQEMNQLAAFQPALYDRFGNAWSDELLGRSGHPRTSVTLMLMDGCGEPKQLAV